jgi:hypothetical protein
MGHSTGTNCAGCIGDGVSARCEKMVAGFQEKKTMNGRQRKKMVREGEFIAEVLVELQNSPEGWGPYLSIQDARKMDQVRVLLRKGDVKGAGRLGRVYRLVPVDA